MLGLVAVVFAPSTTDITSVVVFDISDNDTFVIANGLLGLRVLRVPIFVTFGLCYYC